MESAKKFDVIRQLSWEELDVLESIEVTSTMHASMFRSERYDAYESMGLLGMDFLDGFIVDKGHRNGPEIHCINSSGIIYIFNEQSLRLITVEGARPAQIKRYYRALGILPDEDVRDVILMAEERVSSNPINNL